VVSVVVPFDDPAELKYAWVYEGSNFGFYPTYFNVFCFDYVINYIS